MWISLGLSCFVFVQLFESVSLCDIIFSLGNVQPSFLPVLFKLCSLFSFKDSSDMNVRSVLVVLKIPEVLFNFFFQSIFFLLGNLLLCIPVH